MAQPLSIKFIPSAFARICSSVSKGHGDLRERLIVRKHGVERKAKQQNYDGGGSVRLMR